MPNFSSSPLTRQVIATFLIIFRVASGKALSSDSAQEPVLSTAHFTSSTASSQVCISRVGLQSVEASDPSLVQADKGTDPGANGWQLRDRDIQVHIDRERVTSISIAGAV
jgi:hypothetical protein